MISVVPRDSGQTLVGSLSGAFLSRARPGLCTEAVLLRALEGEPRPAKELWWRGRVSKRAIKTILNAAAKRGMVEINGEEVQLVASLPSSEPASCPPLEALVSQLELEHPHFPVPYGAVDPTFCGRRGGGRDWKPVRREPASSVEGLPMTALLSQALVAFAIDYEKGRRGPIQWAANILDGLDAVSVDVAPVPNCGPHTVANLQRLNIVTVDQDEVVRLTPRGRVMRDAYRPLCEGVESRWRQRLGSSLIDQTIDAVGVDGDWPAFPLIAWDGTEFSTVDNRL